MKQLVLSLALFVGISVTTSAQTLEATAAKATPQGTSITSMAKFAKEKIDLGQIPQGKPVTVDFEYKNISKLPIVLESASASCGCTVPSKPEKPTMPNKSDKISATYNAANAGRFEKTITIKFAGSNETKVLTIAGEVLAAATPAPAVDAPKQ